ncbi:ABC transporter permease [Solirubrobacter sp. CPCC 204708]|uniref:ABC transporter permease n=1 Tax=Solirubrobacter deserti TaxID=2282478 RepID=A0ABT4RUT8_9ACTN|nr:ABC transporter permease [Solirubrobacter deserti]MBE2320968.1 ABC transporter permease [Solirubrobacter deserti]MDA0142262.1 ABC transporter permease [Solirubrobacter deserti]
MTTFSPRRTANLTRWNVVLLSRNRLAFFYAAVFPLLPLALLFTGDRGDEALGARTITTGFLVASLFTIYYNVLSQFVNRRDELVLKRMRTGEAREVELLVSIAMPGALSTLLVATIVVPLAAALGQPLPVNPLLYAVLVVLVIATFSAFAFWTAAWTRSAESAQLTSLPLILLASVGPMTSSIPGMSDALRELLSLTPGAAMSDLIRVGWFGLDGPDATATTLSFAETGSQAAEPLLVLAAWTVIALALARRSIRWEPRT